MLKKLLFPCLIVFFIFSCKSKPSNAEIEKKVLLEYVCPETAKVNSLEIIRTEPATSIMGLKGFQYVVSGEVEWPKGCTDFGTGLPAGYKEKFDSKTVTLIKTEEGWQ